MKDCFDTDLKLGDKVAHLWATRSSIRFRTARIIGFTKQMVVLEGEHRAMPHKLLIVNDDNRFIEGEIKYL
jgi:hypothetical protein